MEFAQSWSPGPAGAPRGSRCSPPKACKHQRNVDQGFQGPPWALGSVVRDPGGRSQRGTPRARSPCREEAPCTCTPRPGLCYAVCPAVRPWLPSGSPTLRPSAPPPPASLPPVSPSPAVLAPRTVPVPLAARGHSAPARHSPGCWGGAPVAGLYPGAPRWRGAQHQDLRPARPCSWLHRLPQLLWDGASRPRPRAGSPSPWGEQEGVQWAGQGQCKTHSGGHSRGHTLLSETDT